MNRIRFCLAVAIISRILFTPCSEVLAQLSTNAPEKFILCESIMLMFPINREEPNQIKTEANYPNIFDAEAVQAIAKSCGLSEDDLATVKIVQKPGAHFLDIYQIGKSDKAFKFLLEPLESYASSRIDGHTRKFLLEGLTNRVAPNLIVDHDLRALVNKHPEIPCYLLKKMNSGTITNKAGEISKSITTFTYKNNSTTPHSNTITHRPPHDEICTWAVYVLEDGEIAWCYTVKFKPDGSLDDVSVEKNDTKEFEPNYQKLIQAVDGDIEKEMKLKGTYGHIGSVHIFWDLKKKKLKEMGIVWRSPADLNPNTFYD